MKRSENEIMGEFLNLVCNSSPENLTCDGELSNKQVQQRLNQINSSWNKLESEIGKKITEEDAWAWYSDQNNNKGSLKP